MNARLSDIIGFLRGTSGPGQVVPPSGISAWLIVFAAAAMTFLAVVALAFALSAGQVSKTWERDIARTATIRISAPADQLEPQTDAVLNVLATTPGIDGAEIMGRAEQAALLKPWIGADLPLQDLDLPRLIKITETAAGPDRAGLRLRLSAEAPAAIYDDHGRWRAPVVQAAAEVARIGLLSFVLTLATLIAVVILAAQAAIISNNRVIATLRLIGARDLFIVRAFVRRITLRAVLGALLGAMAGIVIIIVQPVQASATFGGGLRMSGAEWLYPLCLPILVGIVTFIAARLTVFSMLKRLT